MPDSKATVGCLLGTAAGDALGLPYEGLSPRRARRLFPDTDRHHLLLGRGLVSDDSEHACFAALSLLAAGDDATGFARQLARHLKWWLVGLPAGIGFATLRAIVKLWLGFAPGRSGVYSAGNGPAMRSPLIGVVHGASIERLAAFVGASTRITHTDPKAYYAALAVAVAAYQSSVARARSAASFVDTCAPLLADEAGAELLRLLRMAVESAADAEPVERFAARISGVELERYRGISGYAYHTVPCVLQVWFRYPDDFAEGLKALIRAGGDTDTTGAIYGGIVGARVGRDGIPAAWLDGIAEWPRSVHWIEALGRALAAGNAAPRYFWPGLLLRNAVFLVTVLAHGLRRLAPPY